MTDLKYFFNEQSNLQRKMPTPHPRDIYDGYNPFFSEGSESEIEDWRAHAIDFIHWNVTALTDELHELLGEIGWKPWAKSRHINLVAARGEWIDALHFMLNLGIVLGLDGGDLVKTLYDAKHKKNAQRQEEGYDGVSTKCPKCKRALDDEAVKCYEGKFGWQCMQFSKMGRGA